MIIAAGIELLSLGSIPLFVNHLISNNTSISVFNLNLEDYLNFIPLDNVNLKFATLIFLLFFFKFLFMIFISFYELKVIKQIRIFISENIYSAYIFRSYNFFLKKNSSELGRNVLTEIDNALLYLISILTLSREILLITVIGTLIIYFDPYVSIIGISIISIFVIIFFLLTDKILKNIAKKRIDLSGGIFKHVIETFAMIKEIKVYSKENFFINKFMNIRTSLEYFLFKRDLIIRLPKIVFEFLAVTLIVLLVTSFTVLEIDSVQLLTLLSLIAVAVIRLLPAFNQISIALTHFSSVKNVFMMLTDDMEQYFNQKKREKNQVETNQKILSDNNTEILFDNVDFYYDENHNIGVKNLSLKIKKGEMIGIIGKSGSGKSTFANILLRLLKNQKGEVKFSNENLSCAYVPQDIFLMDASLRDNIVIGEDKRKIDIKKLNNVIEKCELDEFIAKHEKGIDLVLGERGIRISGGEKQRIGLARAFYSEKKIIILDEATSALDNQTEFAIMKSILKFKKEMTIILIAHRLSTLEYCDRVILFENGSIKDQGKLNELLNKYPYLEHESHKSKLKKNDQTESEN
jgi:ATP-binding cassette subfamily C protein